MRLLLLSLCLAVLFANMSFAQQNRSSECSGGEHWHGHTCSDADKLDFPGNDILGDPQETEPPEPDYGGHEDKGTDEGPAPQ